VAADNLYPLWCSMVHSPVFGVTITVMDQFGRRVEIIVREDTDEITVILDGERHILPRRSLPNGARALLPASPSDPGAQAPSPVSPESSQSVNGARALLPVTPKDSLPCP